MVDFSALVVGSTVLRDTMLSIAEITALVPLQINPTEYKIYFEHVPDWVELPYFVISHIAGGSEQSTPGSHAIDIYLKVVLVTADIQVAVSGITALSKMHRLDPIMTSYATGNPGGNPVIRQYSTIREQMPIFDRISVQNSTYFQGGGIYRLRLIEE